MVIRFNRPEDGNFWLTNFQLGYPIRSSLPTLIDEDGKISINSRFIQIDGLTQFDWPTSEHLFQALKFARINPDLALIERIRLAATPEEARNIANAGPRARGDWANPRNYRLNAMCYVIKEKFSQHEELKNNLLATGNEELIEDTGARNDIFWGIGLGGVGQNHLGRILMEERWETKRDRLKRSIKGRIRQYQNLGFHNISAAFKRNGRVHWRGNPNWRRYLEFADDNENEREFAQDNLLVPLSETIIDWLIEEVRADGKITIKLSNTWMNITLTPRLTECMKTGTDKKL